MVQICERSKPLSLSAIQTLIMQCLFEELDHIYLSLESYQDTKIAKYFGV